MNKLLRKLDEVVARAQKMNEYDYNYVIKSLVRNEKQDLKRKARSNQFMKANRRWKNKLINCKKSKEENEQERKEKIIARMKSLQKSHEASLNSSVNSSLDQKMLISSPRDYQQVKQKVQEAMIRDEQLRQDLDLEIKNRIERLSKQNENNRNDLKRKFAEKFENYNKTLENKKVKDVVNNEWIKKREEHDIERFRVYQLYLQQQKEKFKKMKNKEKEKMVVIEEKLSEIEREKEEKRKELQDKINRRTNFISNSIQLKHSSLHSKNNSSLEKFKENFKVIKEENESRKRNVLQKEKLNIEKSLMKERSVDLSRTNIHENILLTSLELEKKVSEVYNKLYNIGNLSILKKSDDQRVGIYNEIKRLKEEARQKEEREKQNKMDSEKK
jgi:hypothetical protein